MMSIRGMNWVVLLVVVVLGAWSLAPVVARADYSGSYGPPVDRPMMAPPPEEPMSPAFEPSLEPAMAPTMVAAPTVVPRGTWIERTPAAVTFRGDMRKLWEDHVILTRNVIISVAAGLPDLDVAVQQLLQNQVDIGNAFRPYYGDAAADRLTALLKTHINLAGDLLVAAKAGDQDKIAGAKASWYANGDEIAAFLNSANPENWPLATAQEMMRMHLDTTLNEATARFSGDWAADQAAYEAVQSHILTMADALSLGVIHQFPQKFGQERVAWMGGHRSGYWNTWGTYGWWRGLPESQVLGETEVLIKIGSFTFEPAEVEVVPGEVVAFYNDSLRNRSIRQSDSDDDDAVAGPYSRVEYPAGIPSGRVYRWVVPLGAQPGTVYHFFSGLPDYNEAGFGLGDRISGKIVVR